MPPPQMREDDFPRPGASVRTRTSTVLVFDKEESKLYWRERAHSGETYSIHAETIAIG